jgi:hypothetical protein
MLCAPGLLRLLQGNASQCDEFPLRCLILSVRKEMPMQCPVCGSAAENITRGDFDGLSVRCKRCGDFDIAGSVLNKLARESQEVRMARGP